VDGKALGFLFRLKLPEFWARINGKFLIVLVAGILTSAYTLSDILSGLLESHPIQLWSFFFGLIIISAIMVAREVRIWTYREILALFIGMVIAYLITLGTTTETPDGLWFIFVCGAIAICAMILPGISGSFILVLMGKYEFIINSIKDLDIGVLITFAAGCAVGLISFSRLVSFLLARFHSITISLLAGFMLGSLNKVWPWKDLETQQSILPNVYQDQGQEPYLFYALLFFAIGILLVVLIEKLANFLKTEE
jgi:putative membrane protein